MCHDEYVPIRVSPNDVMEIAKKLYPGSVLSMRKNQSEIAEVIEVEKCNRDRDCMVVHFDDITSEHLSLDECNGGNRQMLEQIIFDKFNFLQVYRGERFEQLKTVDDLRNMYMEVNAEFWKNNGEMWTPAYNEAETSFKVYLDYIQNIN